MRFHHILDIIQTLVLDLVPLRQHIDLLRSHVDKDVVSDFEGVKVGMRLGPSSLEILAAYKTGIDVDIREADRA